MNAGRHGGSVAARRFRAHLLPLGDEAGPAPASYALHGVDLTRSRSTGRPAGRTLDRGMKMAGLRSPLTMWLIEGAGLNIVVDTGCDLGRDSPAVASPVLREHTIWTRHRPEWTVEAQLSRFDLEPSDIDIVINTCCSSITSVITRSSLRPRSSCRS